MYKTHLSLPVSWLIANLQDGHGPSLKKSSSLNRLVSFRISSGNNGIGSEENRGSWINDEAHPIENTSVNGARSIERVHAQRARANLSRAGDRFVRGAIYIRKYMRSTAQHQSHESNDQAGEHGFIRARTRGTFYFALLRSSYLSIDPNNLQLSFNSTICHISRSTRDLTTFIYHLTDRPPRFNFVHIRLFMHVCRINVYTYINKNDRDICRTPYKKAYIAHTHFRHYSCL